MFTPIDFHQILVLRLHFKWKTKFSKTGIASRNSGNSIFAKSMTCLSFNDLNDCTHSCKYVASSGIIFLISAHLWLERFENRSKGSILPTPNPVVKDQLPICFSGLYVSQDPSGLESCDVTFDIYHAPSPLAKSKVAGALCY